jgi:DNA-binding NtrC family response regulator
MKPEMDLLHLLWADDDSYEALEPLGRRLEKAKFRLSKVVDYVTAIAELDGADEIQCVLLDVILPHAQGSGSLAFDLGMTLANRAANRGVKTIVFLTVVRIDDVLEKFNELKLDFPNVEFSYVDKTQLLEPHAFDNLAQCLRKTRNN